jgi:hypothetical protein
LTRRINRFGLTDDIPADVKRAVRQRCGFGCVVCGMALCDYDHLDPEFANAREHDPNGIVLLCTGCHGRKDRKMLSVETIRRHAASPRARQLGFSFGPFDVGMEQPEFVLGPVRMRNVLTPIRVLGVPLLSIAAPEAEGGPYRLSAVLTDSDGRVVARVVENEWRASLDNWDVQTSGPVITFRRDHRDVVLRLRTDPPNRLVLESMDMLFAETRIVASERRGFHIVTRQGGRLSAPEGVVYGCRVGIEVTAEWMALGAEALEGGGYTRLGRGMRFDGEETP